MAEWRKKGLKKLEEEGLSRCIDFVGDLPLNDEQKDEVLVDCLIKWKFMPQNEKRAILDFCNLSSDDQNLVSKCVGLKTLLPNIEFDMEEVKKYERKISECENEALKAPNDKIKEEFRSWCYSGLPQDDVVMDRNLLTADPNNSQKNKFYTKEVEFKLGRGKEGLIDQSGESLVMTSAKLSKNNNQTTDDQVESLTIDNTKEKVFRTYSIGLTVPLRLRREIAAEVAAIFSRDVKSSFKVIKGELRPLIQKWEIYLDLSEEEREQICLRRRLHFNLVEKWERAYKSGQKAELDFWESFLGSDTVLINTFSQIRVGRGREHLFKIAALLIYFMVIGVYKRVFAEGVKRISQRLVQYIRDPTQNTTPLRPVANTSTKSIARGCSLLRDMIYNLYIGKSGSKRVRHRYKIKLSRLGMKRGDITHKVLHRPPRTQDELHKWLRSEEYNWGANPTQKSFYSILHADAMAFRRRWLKLEDFKKGLLKNYYAVSTYLVSGYLPFGFRSDLALKWGVSPSWVRDLTFGWRKRLDNLTEFPQSLRISELFVKTSTSNPHTSTTHLRLAIMQELSIDSNKEISQSYVLKILSRKRFLHRLFMEEPIPRGLFKRILHHNVAESLRKRLKDSHIRDAILNNMCQVVKHKVDSSGSIIDVTYPHHINISKESFTRAVDEVIFETEKLISRLKPNNREKFYLEAKQIHLGILYLLRGSGPQKEEISPYNKYQIIDKIFAPELALFSMIIPSKKQFYTLSSLISNIQLSNSCDRRTLKLSRYLHLELENLYSSIGIKRVGGITNRLRTVLGEILPRAFLIQIFPQKTIEEISKELVNWLLPRNVLTTPFCSERGRSKREKVLYPLDLSPVDPNSVIFREGSHKELTKIVQSRLKRHEKSNEPIELYFGITSKIQSELGSEQWGIGSNTCYNFPAAMKKSSDALKELLLSFIYKRSKKYKHDYNLFAPSLPMAAVLTSTMREYLSYDEVVINGSRILPPDAGSRKIVVQFIISGPQYRFNSSMRFLKDIEIIKEKPVQIIGFDVNRISPHILAASTSEKFLNIQKDLRQVIELGRKLHWIDYFGFFHYLLRLKVGNGDNTKTLGSLIGASPLDNQGRSLKDRILELLREFQHLKITSHDIIQKYKQELQSKSLFSSITKYLRAQKEWNSMKILSQGIKDYTRGIYAEISRTTRKRQILLNEINHLRSRGKVVPEGKRQKLGRLSTELNRMYQSKSQLKNQLDEEVCLAASRIMIKYGASMMACESLHMTTRGMWKQMAVTVTDMPKRSQIFDRAQDRMNSFIMRSLESYYKGFDLKRTLKEDFFEIDENKEGVESIVSLIMQRVLSFKSQLNKAIEIEKTFNKKIQKIRRNDKVSSDRGIELKAVEVISKEINSPRSLIEDILKHKYPIRLAKVAAAGTSTDCAICGAKLISGEKNSLFQGLDWDVMICPTWSNAIQVVNGLTPHFQKQDKLSLPKAKYWIERHEAAMEDYLNDSSWTYPPGIIPRHPNSGMNTAKRGLETLWSVKS